MTNSFSQIDFRLMAAIRFAANQEPRIDRRAVIHAGVRVFEALDRLTPKKHALTVLGRHCRVNELLITWRDLSRASDWTESSTALRNVVGRFGSPFYLQLPWTPDGRSKGIRVLRMHHSGRGVIADAYDDRKPSRSGRILWGMWITLERIFCLNAQSGPEQLKEMERLVDRLLKPPPSFLPGRGGSYRSVRDPALFTPADVASRLHQMGQLRMEGS